MIETDKKNQFMQLRLKGLSFDKIAKAIGVSKPTLLKWNEENKEAIEKAYSDIAKTIVEEYKLKTGRRFRQYMYLLDRLILEISKRDLEILEIRELLSIKDNIEKSIQADMKVFEESGASVEDNIIIEFVPFRKDC